MTGINQIKVLKEIKLTIKYTPKTLSTRIIFMQLNDSWAYWGNHVKKT